MNVGGIEAHFDRVPDVESSAAKRIAAAGLELRAAQQDFVVGLFAQKRALQDAPRSGATLTCCDDIDHLRPHDKPHGRSHGPSCCQRKTLALDLDFTR